MPRKKDKARKVYASKLNKRKLQSIMQEDYKKLTIKSAYDTNKRKEVL